MSELAFDKRRRSGKLRRDDAPAHYFTEITVALLLLWKAGLLLFAAHPMSVNDFLFYNGLILYYLPHGRQCNPSLATGLPISSRDVFCTYLTLYQLALLGWVQLFGPGLLKGCGCTLHY